MRGSLSSSEQQEVRELSMRFLGCNVPNCNCRNVYSDYLFLILNKLNNMKEIIKCNYKLKPGVLIHVGGEVYSNANLTDEIAKAYIEKYPNTTFFDVIPEETAEEDPVEDDTTEEPIEPVEEATMEEATTEPVEDETTETAEDDETTEEPVDDVPEQVKRGRKKKEE